MKPKHKRMAMIGGALGVLAIATVLVLTALEQNIVFFHSPSEVAAKKIQPGKRFRIGGLVEKGSVKKNGKSVAFRVTDGTSAVRVAYTGILPDLFREGQGVVANGTLNSDGTFLATEILAKHDENYMPREVADALKKSGRWKHYKKNGYGAAGGAKTGGDSKAGGAK
jgi:cytochrome c-type biogenesis protein CcmE